LIYAVFSLYIGRIGDHVNDQASDQVNDQSPDSRKTIYPVEKQENHVPWRISAKRSCFIM